MVSELYQHRRDFWAHFAANEPVLHGRTTPGNEHSRWLAVGTGSGLVVALYLTNRSVGDFVRGERGSRIGHVRERLFAHRDELASALEQPKLKLGERFLLNTSLKLDMNNRRNWDRAGEWLAVEAPRYEAALLDLLLRRPVADDWPSPFI